MPPGFARPMPTAWFDELELGFIRLQCQHIAFDVPRLTVGE